MVRIILTNNKIEQIINDDSKRSITALIPKKHKEVLESCASELKKPISSIIRVAIKDFVFNYTHNCKKCDSRGVIIISDKTWMYCDCEISKDKRKLNLEKELEDVMTFEAEEEEEDLE